MEVLWNGSLEKVFFAVPSECSHLPSASKQKVINELDLSTPELKIKDFMQRSADLYDEMMYIEFMSEFKLYALLWKLAPFFQSLNFALALLINFAIMIGLEVIKGIKKQRRKRGMERIEKEFFFF